MGEFYGIVDKFGLSVALLLIAFVLGGLGKWRWDREYKAIEADRDFWRNDSTKKQDALLEGLTAVKASMVAISEFIPHSKRS